MHQIHAFFYNKARIIPWSWIIFVNKFPIQPSFISETKYSRMGQVKLVEDSF